MQRGEKGRQPNQSGADQRETEDGNELVKRRCLVIHHPLSMPVPWQPLGAKPIHAFHSGDFLRARHFSPCNVTASSLSDTKGALLYPQPRGRREAVTFLRLSLSTNSRGLPARKRKQGPTVRNAGRKVRDR